MTHRDRAELAERLERLGAELNAGLDLAADEGLDVVVRAVDGRVTVAVLGPLPAEVVEQQQALLDLGWG